MVTQTRMSPFTALFLAFGFIAVAAIGAGTTITLYGMNVVDSKANGVLSLVENAIGGLPEVIDSLPPALSDLLNDRRAPEYAPSLATQVAFADDPASGVLIPSLQITNKGTEVVSMLGIRVTLLNKQGAPLHEWNELAAAPISIEDLRGPLLPGNTRYIVLPCRRNLTKDAKDQLQGAVEITEIRVWEPEAQAGAPIAAAP